MQVVTSDDDGAGHFALVDHSSQNVAANRDVARPWTLLVDVRSLGCLESRKLELEIFVNLV